MKMRQHHQRVSHRITAVAEVAEPASVGQSSCASKCPSFARLQSSMSSGLQTCRSVAVWAEASTAAVDSLPVCTAALDQRVAAASEPPPRCGWAASHLLLVRVHLCLYGPRSVSSCTGWSCVMSGGSLRSLRQRRGRRLSAPRLSSARLIWLSAAHSASRAASRSGSAHRSPHTWQAQYIHDSHTLEQSA